MVDEEQPNPELTPRSDDAQDDADAQQRRLGRWTAIGLAAALLGALGGILIELIFS